MRKVMLFLVVGALCFGLGLTPGSSQEDILDSLVNFDVKDMPLKYFLGHLSFLTGVSIIPDNDVTGKVTARFINQPLREVLNRILEINDCEYKLVDDIIRVIRIPVISRIFPLKFALASDMEKIIKTYLSPEGTIQVNEERNELIIIDTSYYLEKVENLLAALDSQEKQIRKESFPIKYARIENLALLLRENLSSKGNLEVDEERSLIRIKDTSYHLSRLERLIQKEDTFIPKKKRYRIRFAPLILVAEEAEEILSDKGTLEIEEDTSSFVVSDVAKNLEKIEKLVRKMDTLEAQLIPPLVFQDEDLMEALRTISQTTGVSIVVDPGVEGKVNLIFGRPTALLKVLPQILEPNHCRYEIIGDTIRVIPIPLFKMVFPLKYALASEIGESLESLLLLSPKGSIQVDEEVNSLLVSDKRPYLEEIARFIQELDSQEKQIRKESFPIKYARIKDLALLLRENLSSKGNLEVDEERSLISIEDSSYYISRLGKLIQEEDSFIPKKKRYRMRFAPLILVAEKAEEMLSDKGTLEIDEDTSSFLVSDVVKNLEKIEKLVRNMDNLEDWLVTKKYFLTYLTPEEARPLLQVLMTDYGEIRLPRMRGVSEGTEKQEEYIIIPQEEPAPREAVSERVFDGQLSETASEKLPSLEEGEREDTVIYVTDLKRNIPNIDVLITYLNGAEKAGEIITKTFYLKEGSLERMALAMASILGISPDDIEGLEPKGEWMQMEVPTLEINLGTVGPR